MTSSVNRALAGLLLAATLVGCSSEPGRHGGPPASPEESSPGAQPYTGYPGSIAVLGHSGATGEGSDGRPGVEVRENSWATGTNPEVDSVYLRILVKNPAIDGRAVNFAEAGADLAMIIGQADRAIALHPDLELVLVQAVDGDLQCPAGEADLTLFEERLTELLTLLTSGLPRARIFLVNQDPHAPRKEAEMLTIAERRQLGGTGPCAFLGPEGQIVPRELARLQHIIARYAERLASVCDAFERCENHPQAFRFSADRELRAPDLNHASIKGLAHHAELAWRALLQTGLVPRPKQ